MRVTFAHIAAVQALCFLLMPARYSMACKPTAACLFRVFKGWAMPPTAVVPPTQPAGCWDAGSGPRATAPPAQATATTASSTSRKEGSLPWRQRDGGMWAAAENGLPVVATEQLRSCCGQGALPTHPPTCSTNNTQLIQYAQGLGTGMTSYPGVSATSLPLWYALEADHNGERAGGLPTHGRHMCWSGLTGSLRADWQRRLD